MADRPDDRQLAWLIVGTCAALSLALLVTLALLARGPIARWADNQMRAQHDAAAARRERLNEDLKVDEASPENVRLVHPNSDAPAHPRGNVAALFGPDAYPRAALRAGEEGRVRVRVVVDPAGTPTGCSVAESSGSWSLDNATCGILLRGARFDPAPRGVRGVRFWTSPRVRWQLPS